MSAAHRAGRIASIPGSLRGFLTDPARIRGAWLRFSRWEYWPGWAIYGPIVPRLVWRARRFGGLRSATCVNPAIALGGLVGESKSEILGRIGPRVEVARWELIAPGSTAERLARVEALAGQLGSGWPIVLKPDRGERGAGVRIVRDARQAADALGPITIPVIAQEYVSGEEYGVFWYRDHGDRGGKILSVAHKAMVSVVGDGCSTIDELFAREVRILPMIGRHRDRFRARLREVPGQGEVVQVTELGTHARGSTFLDACEVASDSLAAALDAVMEGSGLDFGRFDLKVPSRADLRAGRNLRILEFNGLSAEAAHIYDPDRSLRAAHATLLDQWTIALRIGAKNRGQGRSPASWGEILGAWRRHLADRRSRGA